MPYNAFQTMSLCPFVACQEQHLTPSTKNERRLPQWSWEYFGLLTGRDEKCHRKRKISRHSPKIMGTIPQNHGDYPPKSWGLSPKIMGTETSEIQTTKIKRKYTPQLESSAQKSQYAHHCTGVFCALSQNFFLRSKKTSPIMALPSLPVGSHKARTMQRPLHGVILHGVILSVSRIVATLPIWQRLCQSSHQALMPS